MINFLQNLFVGFISLVTAIVPLGGSIPTPVAGFETYLASKITPTDTTMTLASVTTGDGTSLTTGTVYGFVIDSDTASEEYVLGTASSTSILNMTRGVSVITGDTSIAALKKDHRKGASVKITDAPVLLVLARQMNGDEGIPNSLFYDTSPSFSSSTQITDKNYQDTNFLSKTSTSSQTMSGALDVTGQATFTLAPMTSDTPDSGDELTNKAYVDAQVIAGGIPASTSTIGAVYISTNPATSSLPTAVGDNDTRVPTQGENDALAGTSGTPSSTNKYVTNDDTTTTTAADKLVRLNSSGLIDNSMYVAGSFGGDGSDGALSITSGTTTIDLAGANYLEKNYTSISITGTSSKLMFSNPSANGTIIILRSQGNCTLTSTSTPMIDASGLGAAAGGGGNPGGAGGAGSSPLPIITGGGGGGTNAAGGAGGKLQLSYSNTGQYRNAILGKYIDIATGGGGGGGYTLGVAAAGGRGGGVLIIECGGSWEFTTTNGISVAGVAGSNGSGNVSAGGGGGGGGIFIGLYNTLVSNTGSVNYSGGAQSINGNAGSTVYGGGGGASLFNAGNPGLSSGGGAAQPSGGSGGSGYYIISSFEDL